MVEARHEQNTHCNSFPDSWWPRGSQSPVPWRHRNRCKSSSSPGSRTCTARPRSAPLSTSAWTRLRSRCWRKCKWLQSTVAKSRQDLALPSLKSYVSQELPTDAKELNAIDITANLAAIAASDPAFIHLKAFHLPPQEEKLVITTAGIVQLGELLAQSYLEHR